MESEKVKEIKKVLEEGQFNTINHHQKEGKPIKISFADILTLINELESENERLIAEKQKVLEYMKTDNYAKLKKEDMYWGYQMGIGMLEHEIDRQKDRIAELETKNEVLCVELSRYTEHCVEMKNGTLKQFAERLKEDFAKKKNKLIKEREIAVKYNSFILVDTLTYKIYELKYAIDKIDETLKEFIK